MRPVLACDLGNITWYSQFLLQSRYQEGADSESSAIMWYSFHKQLCNSLKTRIRLLIYDQSHQIKNDWSKAISSFNLFWKQMEKTAYVWQMSFIFKIATWFVIVLRQRDSHIARVLKKKTKTVDWEGGSIRFLELSSISRRLSSIAEKQKIKQIIDSWWG